jgi:hypothetical protein
MCPWQTWIELNPIYPFKQLVLLKRKKIKSIAPAPPLARSPADFFLGKFCFSHKKLALSFWSLKKLNFPFDH